jgi:CBS domain-containing protein
MIGERRPERQTWEVVMIASILSGKKSLISVTPDTLISRIVALLHEHRIGVVLVLDGESIAGLISERDICGQLHKRGAAILTARASEIMTTPVITVAPTESIAGAMGTMTDRRFRHLPVVEDGRLLGLVSIGDLVKARIEQAEAEAQAMKDYISS